ncbi:MAG TPA: thiamine pyrophosphate-dependent dehydrogenase E1 component subunit alpha [Phenylobacterium sp.]|uniref:thiamine pyrophosphate-dependent dehydrogenase E1 component subunit alpha n=1 Tax=Phenylobacterium sp. TaxID=1871053 RepID=UPI002B4A4511|nr:thiamine pyrophosphate-dependent dehydrogenase E1 component subunit alpha [Phenylobacterium sp.]HKQ94918.1 thiamine pyrophosphate-dependent dehydrogenase E1 component subunit alpha [Aestuariivirgaceae bacterium]HKR90261.1 thiamine pyrophosphate-dependent dehydrogenase E1 component subunit alpha [Phenylobacterium sp.]HKT53371.1 thiamine pyrophosphate-dependent dehydrogenase E1 component subunit alpha [Caulobacteraceae bacterium]
MTDDQKVTLFENLVRVRELDEWFINALMTGKLALFYHSTQVQEAVGVGGCTFLEEGDCVYATHRGHGISKLIPRGVSIESIIAEHYGKLTGNSGGASGWHPVAPEKGFPMYTALIAENLGLACGTAMAAKLDGKRRVVVAFEGDSAAAKAEFHEAVNFAAANRLPLIVVIENNEMGQHTPLSTYLVNKDIAKFAPGYGIPGVIVDGQDVIAVHEAVQEAVRRARAGEGPSLIECKTYRLRGHSEGGPDVSMDQPRSKDEADKWLREKDPIKLFGAKLLAEEILTQADIDEIHQAAREEIEEAVKLAAEGPVIPSFEHLQSLLFAE